VEHEYYSDEEVDFGDEPTLPDTGKFSHISEEEMQGDVLAMVSPTWEIATAEGIPFILHNCFSIRLGTSFNISFLIYSTGLAASSKATTSFHIEEMIQELAQ